MEGRGGGRRGIDKIDSEMGTKRWDGGRDRK